MAYGWNESPRATIPKGVELPIKGGDKKEKLFSDVRVRFAVMISYDVGVNA